MKKALILIVFLMSGIWSTAQTQKAQPVYQNSYVKFVYGNYEGQTGLFVQSLQPGIFKINWECGEQFGYVATMGTISRITFGEIHGQFYFKLFKLCQPNSTSDAQWKLIGIYNFNL